jgi:predicted alpha/beta superfamily hydrolase
MAEGHIPQAEIIGTRLHMLRSQFYDVEHQISIFLPPRVNGQPEATYPVLYVTDANWLFGSAACALLLYSEARATEDVILVGVGEGSTLVNIEASRGYRFTPQPHPIIPEGGGADAFCQFFTKQLFPFIEQTYSARSDDRGVVGFSLGGLWASYVMAQHSQMFQRYVVISPPVAYAGEQIYAGLEQLRARSADVAVYAAISEHDYRDCRDSWQPWIDALSLGRSSGIRLRHEEFSGEYHDSVAIPAMLRGIRHLYGRPDFTPPPGPS